MTCYRTKMKTKPITLPSVDDDELTMARKILGDLVKDWPDEKIRDEVASTKYLVETWLDDYERQTFGDTLANIVPNFNQPKITGE